MPKAKTPRRPSNTRSSTPARPSRTRTGKPASELPAIIPLLASGAGLDELMPALHQHVLATTGGRTSVVFEPNRRTGALQPTSCSGVPDASCTSYAPAPHEHAIVESAFEKERPALIVDASHTMPELATRANGAEALLLIPLLRRGERVGLLVVGFRRRPAENSVATCQLAEAFVTALDLGRLRAKDARQRDIRAVLGDFAARLSSLNLQSALDPLCADAARLFSATRVTVWLADRRARDLGLKAASDASLSGHTPPKSLIALAQGALRGTRAELAETDAQISALTIPLRGTRRALGAMVFEGLRIDTVGDLDLLERADEVGRQLSSALENMQLLDNVLRSRRELENTFDSITDLVVVCDRRGQITQINQAFANRLGLTREQLLDRQVDDTVGAELAAWLRDHSSRSVRRGQLAETTMEIHDPVLNGRFLITISDLLNSDREPVGTVIVGRDLSAQMQLEAEREELRKRLTQSEKLAALGEFVAGIAHELNNPLQGVLGHLELLRATGAFPRQLRREVQTIYREADRAAKIVRNLLVFAGSRRLARRSVSANIILQKVVALRTAACRAADIELVRHYDDGLPRVQSDPLLLHQAFLNIVMNAEQAVTATGRPGRIEVATSLAEGGERVQVTIRDTGHGIPPDALGRIFEPFYTTKEVGKGTGLGLAIAYGIIQEHGGLITATNHPEGGAVFTVELPTTTVA